MVNPPLQIPQKIKTILDEVSDPEIPVLSVLDLGIIRKIDYNHPSVCIEITPTYSGCPAMDTIATDIKLALEKFEYKVEVKLVLAPAWTTDWITERGRNRLREYGVAPPLSESMDAKALYDGGRVVQCTNCQSNNTIMISQFGSTACKSLFKCEDCLEPFDYFKCLK